METSEEIIKKANRIAKDLNIKDKNKELIITILSAKYDKELAHNNELAKIINRADKKLNNLVILLENNAKKL